MCVEKGCFTKSARLSAFHLKPPPITLDIMLTFSGQMLCECACFDAEVRDGTLPAVLVCPERSQPIIPLNYLLTRWN